MATPNISLNTGLTGSSGPPRPWEAFDWEPSQQLLLYKQWADYYRRLGLLNKALKMLDKAILLDEEDPQILIQRSFVKRGLVQPQLALIDGLDAQELNGMNVKACLEVADALYEDNKFEESFSDLNDNNLKFPDKSGDGIRHRLEILHQNFMDALGHNLVEFFDTHKDIIPLVFALNQEKLRIDNRPLWKILREQGKCDVQSNPDIDPEILSPLEIARRKRCFKVFCQIYINRSWIDVEFLKTLLKNRNMSLSGKDPEHEFTGLKSLVENRYKDVIKFLKMLHARSPLYNEKPKMCPNKRACKMMHAANLYRIQYATRRTMFIILNTVKQMRKDGELDKLIKYVEEVMGNWVVIKTNRVMPWKFEFINEVYNVLALAHADSCIIPPDINKYFMKDQLKVLLNLPVEGPIVANQIVFGDRSTFAGPDVTDYKSLASRRIVARLERRLRFAKYPIEQCYIRFEIARQSLLASRLKECEHYAKKAVDSADLCNNILWKFLSLLLICKEHASQHKLEPTEVVLKELQELAQRLRDPNLCAFVEKGLSINSEDQFARKINSSHSSVKRSRQSSEMYL